MKKFSLLVLLSLIGAGAAFGAAGDEHQVVINAMKGLNSGTQSVAGDSASIAYGLGPIAGAVIVMIIALFYSMKENKQEQGSGLKIGAWAIGGLVAGYMFVMVVLTVIASNTIGNSQCGMDFHTTWWKKSMLVTMGGATGKTKAAALIPPCLNSIN